MIGWLKKRYFNPEDPLEYHIFMIFFFECFLLSLVSGVLDGMMEYGVVGNIVQWGFNLACVILLMVSPRIRPRLQKPMLIFITFIYIPFLYFESGGHDGSILMFALLGTFMLAFVFKGKQMIAAIGLSMAIYMIMVWAGYQMPGLVIFHGHEEARILDLITSIPMCVIALATMAVYVSRAYESSNKNLAHLATKDELTGVYNRRSLSELLIRKMKTDGEGHGSFIIMMLDIDFFKKINDTYGHGFGDTVLCRFAEAVQHVLRRQDIMARYGGEEFVLILDAVETGRAIEIAQRVREAVKAISFDRDLQVTVSIGVTCRREHDTIDGLLMRVDENLYKAKQNGRDRVVHDLNG